MSGQLQLTWWWKRNGAAGNPGEECEEGPSPFCSTPGQEDRFRRLLALLEECEAEIARVRAIDPEGESDQSQGLALEKDGLGGAVLHAASALNLHDHPRHHNRILSGRPWEARPGRPLPAAGASR